MFKINNKNNTVMKSFCSGIFREPHLGFPGSIYLFKFSNSYTRIRCKTCSKLTIKILELHQWCLSNLSQIPHLFLMLLLWALSMCLFAGFDPFILQLFKYWSFQVSSIYWKNFFEVEYFYKVERTGGNSLLLPMSKNELKTGRWE